MNKKPKKGTAGNLPTKAVKNVAKGGKLEQTGKNSGSYKKSK